MTSTREASTREASKCETSAREVSTLETSTCEASTCESYEYLIIEPTNGLCNRLRAMASGWILANHLKREFKVVWNCTPDIGYAKYTDLFEKPNWLLPHLPENLTSVYTSGRKTEKDQIVLICKDQSKTIVLKQTGGNYMPPGMNSPEFNTLKSQFYNTLKPIKKIYDAIQTFDNLHQLKHCLGVHIRRKDRKHFTPSTEMFSRAIERYKQTNTILLSTDEPVEIGKLRKLCKKKIIVYPKTIFERNTIESVQQALIEWNLLSKCDIGIVYSHSSSFGYEACMPNKIVKTIELRSTREKTENEKRNLPKLTFQ